MNATTDQEIIECALLLTGDLSELCFEMLRYEFGAEPARVSLLRPLFESESDPSLRTALAVVIVSVTDYEPAMTWLVKNDGWTEIDFKICREGFHPR